MKNIFYVIVMFAFIGCSQENILNEDNSSKKHIQIHEPQLINGAERYIVVLTEYGPTIKKETDRKVVLFGRFPLAL